MGRLLGLALLLVAAGVSLGLFLTRATPLDDDALDGLSGDAVAGAQVFHAAGCASCHAAPGAKGENEIAGALDAQALATLTGFDAVVSRSSDG